jgi:transposase
MHQVLSYVRNDPRYASKNVIVLMDNAVVHRHSAVLETCRRLNVNVLFNAEYSPWLNPVEQMFGFVKGQMKNKQPKNK